MEIDLKTEELSKIIAKQYFLGYNEGYCSSLGCIFKGNVDHLVEKSWIHFIPISEEIMGKL